MRFAYRAVVCLFFTTLVTATNISAEISVRQLRPAPKADLLQFKDLYDGRPDNYTFNLSFRSKNSRNIVVYTAKYNEETLYSLQDAVMSRLGLPYRYNGTDDRGYDCSGFVWRVFHEAGVDFQRSSTRRLWEILPEATKKERAQYGTLVFFEGLNHVGIVRDAASFYHASSSKGVVRSHFSPYWENRIIGYRRVYIFQRVPRARQKANNLIFE